MVMKTDIIDCTISMMALRVTNTQKGFIFYVNKNIPVTHLKSVDRAMLKYLNNTEA